MAGASLTFGLLGLLPLWLPFALGLLRARKAAAPAFRFSPFSSKQLMLLTWWTRASPYGSHDGVIAEGSIRSGKTVGMIDSFVTWSLWAFPQGEDFIIAGRSMGALRRNVLKPLFQILRAKGLDYHYHRSEHWVQIGANTYHLFGASSEASQDVVQGLTAAGALFDEVALMPQSFVDQAIGRCSVEGSKLFFNCNPEGPYHWFKVEYLDKATQKRLLHLHFTLDDNPSLSAQIRDRYRRMFSGVWFKRYILGQWVVAEGLIYDMFSEKAHVAPAAKVYPRYGVGIDYGTSGVCVFGLYAVYQEGGTWKAHKIRERYYDARSRGKQKTDAEHADDFEAFLQLVDGRKITPSAIYCDPSAASFIAELRRRGFRVAPAVNDVVDGIRFVSQMLSEGRYRLDPSCTETIREKSSYAWDPKAQERGEDKPLKQDDHCFVAGTLVETVNGPRPIETIRPGDLVLTRTGCRRVVWSGITNMNAEVNTYRMPNGALLTATPNHPVFTANRGYAPIDQVMQSDTLCILEEHSTPHEYTLSLWPQSQRKSSSRASRFAGIRNLLARVIGAISSARTTRPCAASAICTGPSTRTTTGQSPGATTSTTGTATGSTTTSPTSCCCRPPSTRPCTLKRAIGWAVRSTERLFIELKRRLSNGTDQMKVERGIASRPSRCGRSVSSAPSAVSSAVSPIKRAASTTAGSIARTPASPLPAATPAPMTRGARAPSAAPHTSPIATEKAEPARGPALLGTVGRSGRAAVYNIHVEGEEEYFANGVLVHNCSDEERYFLYSHFSGKTTIRTAEASL